MNAKPYNSEDLIILTISCIYFSTVKKAIEKFELNYDNFKSNYIAYTSCAMSILLAANYIKKVSMKFMKKHSHIPWNKFIVLANTVVDSVNNLELDDLCKFVVEDAINVYDEMQRIRDIETVLSCQKYLNEYGGEDAGADLAFQKFIDKGLGL